MNESWLTTQCESYADTRFSTIITVYDNYPQVLKLIDKCMQKSSKDNLRYIFADPTYGILELLEIVDNSLNRNIGPHMSKKFIKFYVERNRIILEQLVEEHNFDCSSEVLNTISHTEEQKKYMRERYEQILDNYSDAYGNSAKFPQNLEKVFGLENVRPVLTSDEDPEIIRCIDYSNRLALGLINNIEFQSSLV